MCKCKIEQSYEQLLNRQKRLIRFAKQRLGNRLIVVTGTVEELFKENEITKALSRRGFNVSRNAKIFGFGEMRDICAIRAVDKVAKEFAIPKERTKVVDKGTEVLDEKTKKFIIKHDPWKKVKQKRGVRYRRRLQK